MSPRGAPARRVVIVSSTAERDVALRDELAAHLLPTARKAAFDVWHEGSIPAGQKLSQLESETALAAAVVVLLTPDLFADEQRRPLAEGTTRRSALTGVPSSSKSGTTPSAPYVVPVI